MKKSNDTLPTQTSIQDSWSIALLLSVSTAPAQTITGQITGTVVDASGAVVPGAQVVVKNEGAGFERQAKTNEAGSFVFVALPPSTYTVTVEMAGFSRHASTDVVLVASQELALGNIA